MQFLATPIDYSGNPKPSIPREHMQWEVISPPSIRSATGVFGDPIWAYLTHAFGIGGPIWPARFVSGLPIVGEICRANLFKIETSRRKSPELRPDISAMFDGSGARFAKRSLSPKPKHGTHLSGGAMSKIEQGWSGRFFLFIPYGGLADYPDIPINLRSREPSAQSDKVGACDDFKMAHINRFCNIAAPVPRPSWGHIVRFMSTTSPAENNWSFGKADHISAYKKLAMRGADGRLAYIALFNSIVRRWFAMRPTTLLFGPTSAFPHYNTPGRLFFAIIAMILRIPIFTFSRISDSR